uniref:BHLH domain-containing protein n=1 Tax=Biomphalaria glabrata TaxID=6526 RepID=A0A2C9JMB2_BIOGL
MPAAIAMASSKLSPSLTSGGSMSTISIPVSAYHDPANNVITITPYILLKTTTVAEQMQVLRQEKKIGSKAPEPSTGAMRVKRRTDMSKLGLPEPKPASVSRRNARERNRVKQVNQGFETLREHVPNGKKNKKMSKVQTLRSAAQYIKDLYMILHGELPALGSPNVVDEPDSPLDNSDVEMSVSSPESQAAPANLHQSTIQQQQMVSSPTISSQQSPPSLQAKQAVSNQQSQISLQMTSPPHQLRPKAVPLILKKEPSVIHQQLARVLQQQSQTSSVLKQQLQAPLPVQPANIQVHQHRLRLALNQVSKITLDQRNIQQSLCNISTNDIQSHMAANEMNNHLTTNELDNNKHLPTNHLDNDNHLTLNELENQMTTSDIDNDNLSSMDSDSSLHSECSPLTYTQLSPAQHTDTGRSYDLRGLTPDYNDFLNTKHYKLPPSPFQNHNDVNMNLISSDATLLQNYLRSMQSDHEKLLPSDLTRSLSSVHSPSPSLSSSTSDVSAVYECDSLDKEALLDISNWISELCSSQGVTDLGQN